MTGVEKHPKKKKTKKHKKHKKDKHKKTKVSHKKPLEPVESKFEDLLIFPHQLRNIVGVRKTLLAALAHVEAPHKVAFIEGYSRTMLDDYRRCKHAGPLMLQRPSDVLKRRLTSFERQDIGEFMLSAIRGLQEKSADERAAWFRESCVTLRGSPSSSAAKI